MRTPLQRLILISVSLCVAACAASPAVAATEGGQVIGATLRPAAPVEAGREGGQEAGGAGNAGGSAPPSAGPEPGSPAPPSPAGGTADPAVAEALANILRQGRVGQDAAVIAAEREYLSAQNLQVLALLDRGSEGLYRWRNPAMAPTQVIVSGVPLSLARLIAPVARTRTRFEDTMLLEAAGGCVEALRVLRDLPTDAVLADHWRRMLGYFPPENGTAAVPAEADSEATEKALEPLTDFDRLRFAYLERRRLGLQPELVLETLALTGFSFARLAEMSLPEWREVAGRTAGPGMDVAAVAEDRRRAFIRTSLHASLAADAWTILHSLLQPDAMKPRGTPGAAAVESAAARLRLGGAPLPWEHFATDRLIAAREVALREARLEVEAAGPAILQPLLDSGLYAGGRSLGTLPGRYSPGFLDAVVEPSPVSARLRDAATWTDWMGGMVAISGPARSYLAGNPAPPVPWWSLAAPAGLPGR